MDEDIAPGETLALSAFALSRLPSDRDRQDYVKKMWKSEAEVLVSHEATAPYWTLQDKLAGSPIHVSGHILTQRFCRRLTSRF